MSENFKVEIVNPDQSFFTSEEAKEVVIPAIEGEMGILKDHISIISFLKPGIIKINLKDEEQKFYVEDGIIEFKDSLLSILTSKIYSLKNLDQNLINQSLKDAEKELENSEISDQSKFIYAQKVEVLKNLN